jgi:hypothetical protein
MPGHIRTFADLLTPEILLKASFAASLIVSVLPDRVAVSRPKSWLVMVSSVAEETCGTRN